MKAASFAIMALLVAALVNATPAAVHSSSDTPASLAGGMNAILGKVRNHWGTDKTLHNPVGSSRQTTLVKVQVGTKELYNNSNCITHEHCKEKKVICSKKCRKQHGDISKMHIPKCVVRCKKCVPNC